LNRVTDDIASYSITRSDVPLNFNYDYEPNSYDMIKSVTGPTHTVTNTYNQYRDILASKENKVATTNISTYSYGVNAINQRTDVSKTGSAFATAREITWGYNSKGEVVKADHSADTAFNRAYQYDGIGNRLQESSGTSPASVTTYTPNALNQYSSINNQSTIINPQFDDDGNATAYPLPTNLSANTTLLWDAENRLIEVLQAGTNVPLVRYTYDSLSRRIAETTNTNTSVYVYDGWNPIAEYSISNNQYSMTRSYTWGLDLSGSMQGAGGVGGLLAVAHGNSTYYPTYDGNGNISEYLDSTGNIVAHYEYDPFGKTTVANGAKVNEFTHRFSTKPLDITTGLYYYGYRFYDPVTGRWPSKDPLEENWSTGEFNEYVFITNSTINSWDYIGLSKQTGNQRQDEFKDWSPAEVDAEEKRLRGDNVPVLGECPRDEISLS